MKKAALITDGSCLGNPGPGGWVCILRFGAVKSVSLYTGRGAGVIETLKHKGLRRLYEKNDRSGIRPDMVDKVQKILSALEAADSPEDMALPMFRFHPLTGDRRGTYSVTVKANWRIHSAFTTARRMTRT